jgi:hypothetical protein
MRRHLVWVLPAALAAGIVSMPSFAATHAKIIKYTCMGTEHVIFDNTNIYPVASGATRPVFTTHGKAYCVTYIQTYHWNGGKGPGIATGFVGLSGQTAASRGGKHSLGSWRVTASNGQNNAPNVNWHLHVQRLRAGNLVAEQAIARRVLHRRRHARRHREVTSYSRARGAQRSSMCPVFQITAAPAHVTTNRPTTKMPSMFRSSHAAFATI